jgi:hypothetical protein
MELTLKNHLKLVTAFSILALLFLACALPGLITEKPHLIGFDFNKNKPSVGSGDITATGHIFIHQYEIPADGWVTGYTFLNDTEPNGSEIKETVTLLILRPLAGGWLIIHDLELPPDDIPISKEGTTTVTFESPIKVYAGEIFGHFQGNNQTGPFPINIDDDAIDGLSIGQAGFDTADIQEGKFILSEGFSGSRDYFINLIFSE